MKTRSGISYGKDEDGFIRMDILPDIRIHGRKENKKIKEEKKFKRDWKTTPNISEMPIANWVEKVLLGFLEEK